MKRNLLQILLFFLQKIFLCAKMTKSMQRCQSGRMCRSRKPVYPKGYRGFKSLSLRQTKQNLSNIIKLQILFWDLNQGSTPVGARPQQVAPSLWLKTGTPACFLDASRLSLRHINKVHDDPYFNLSISFSTKASFSGRNDVRGSLSSFSHRSK